MQRSLSAIALALACLAAAAQVPPEDPDWKELDAPPPPALRTSGLIPLDVPGTSLRWGIDPASVSVGPDRIVRYVVVATSASGTVNAMYEGIRCDGGEVRVYAHHNPDSGWVRASNAQWQRLVATPNSRHSLIIAQSGACNAGSPSGSAADIVNDLRAPIERRFERGGANR